jgi:hypothetical protein
MYYPSIPWRSAIRTVMPLGRTYQRRPDENAALVLEARAE